MHGISGLRKAVGLVEALNHLDEFYESDKTGPEPKGRVRTASERESDLEQSRKAAALADAEFKNGFPLLHAHSTVAMWGALESTVRDVVVAMLGVEPASAEREPFSRIRIPLVEFERLDAIDRLRFLVSAVERDRNLEFAPGIERF